MPHESVVAAESFAALPNLPRPFPDELLYSLIARSGVHLGQWSPKQLLGALYGHRGTLAVPDLPSSLSQLAGVCKSWGLTIEEIAHRHTLFPYYTHFLQPHEKAWVLEAMLHRRGYLHVRLGVCAGGVARTAFFRLCAACTQEDLARYGETYWRRAHHLPGIVVCASHGQMLLETSVPFRPIGRHEHVGAHPRLLARAMPVLPRLAETDAALTIARRSVELLAPAAEMAATDYRAALRSLGMVSRRGGAARLGAAVLAVIPEALLPAMFASVTAEGLPRWLDLARRKPRRALHPLKHVVMKVVLESLSKPAAAGFAPAEPTAAVTASNVELRRSLLRERAICLATTGLTTRAIALKLGVAWKTADRLLRPPAPKPSESPVDSQIAADRRAWSALRSTSPTATRTELRRAAPAVYARLYRADRAWLLAQPAPRYPRRPVTRIDWARRDRELAGRAGALIEEISARTPPIRASRHRVLGELQARPLLALRGAKLPKTSAILALRCETAEQFQFRRVALILKSHPADSRLLGDAALLRAARINPDRLPDRGVALLEAARRSCG